jgi:tryptophan synthase alpha chain
MPAADRPAQLVIDSIRHTAASGRMPLIPFVTAGYPSLDALPALLQQLAPHAAVIEIGLPFTDPMADGLTIQRSSRIALENGMTLERMLEQVRQARRDVPALPPLVVMSYLNPLLPRGLERLSDDLRDAGIAGLIIPDLPMDEAEPVRRALHARSIGLIGMVTPVTDPLRAAAIAGSSDGFLYAVMLAGVTGARDPATNPTELLRRVRPLSPVPVAAGFGIRTPDQVRALRADADAVIVGSALIECIERGESPAELLATLATP